MIKLKDPTLFMERGLVAGQWLSADSGLTIEVDNPASGEVLGTVPNMGAVETRRAIEAAQDRR
jgi:succinate-semialdehyde dehydrogenase/glutarate-semialdehyde dehydrogenase